MRFVSKELIELGRELSDLDLFALDFIKNLKKYSKYVIVSGYVSILLGRSRSSEDIDMIIPKIEQSKFSKLLKELKENDFYCLNAEDEKEIYEYLNEGFAVRFAKKESVIPNMELKFAKNKIDDLTLKKIIRVKVNEDEIIISHLELQIAFKEKVLKSPKDLEDARHLRNIAKDNLDFDLIKQYEVMLDGF